MGGDIEIPLLLDSVWSVLVSRLIYLPIYIGACVCVCVCVTERVCVCVYK